MGSSGKVSWDISLEQAVCKDTRDVGRDSRPRAEIKPDQSLWNPMRHLQVHLSIHRLGKTGH